MASDRLEVNLDGLTEFADNLDTIRASMRDAHGWMNEFSGDMGGADVDDALADFESHWSDGRSVVDKNCERLVKLARQAVENLRQTDTDLANELRKGMES